MTLALRDSPDLPTPTDDYLAALNAEQRAAVEHGEGKVAAPLLVIAGAGSGKTNTLAHRVAHLIVNGADPRRILLMTFSRRAASEMTKRVERIASRVMGQKAATLTEGLDWTGTFHAIGARLLRDYALEIGLDPAFTIHDREDSADLMNLVRHELGLSKTESRFPAKGTCLAIYSRAVNAQCDLEPVLTKSFPWCVGWVEELKQLFAAYVDAKQAQNVLDYDDLLLWWAQMCAEPAIAEHLGARFDHILVDEYQDTNRLQESILLALRQDTVGCRSRRCRFLSRRASRSPYSRMSLVRSSRKKGMPRRSSSSVGSRAPALTAFSRRLNSWYSRALSSVMGRSRVIAGMFGRATKPIPA